MKSQGALLLEELPNRSLANIEASPNSEKGAASAEHLRSLVPRTGPQSWLDRPSSSSSCFLVGLELEGL
jgi:hypothetical protein